MDNYIEQIESYIKLECEMLGKIDKEAVNLVMQRLEKAREIGAAIYICGNGGSAATASHFVCDFNKGVSLTQDKKYQFICLNDNIPSLMAIANDIGYEEIFRVQIEGKLKKNDVFIGISGSGNSKNVILAAEYAKAQGADVIAMTGYSGGALGEISDLHLHVPIDNMQITEDMHMIFDHMMMYILSQHGE